MMIPRILIGISLTSLACAMNAVGLNMQAISKKKKSGSLYNGIGIFLSTSCGLVDICSYGFAPQSVLAPIGALTLVINLLLAPFFHGKTLTFRQIFYTVVIVSGVVTCVLSGGDKGEEPEYSESEIFAFFGKTPFRCLVAVLAATFVSLQLHIRRREASGHGAHLSTGFAYPVCAGMLGASTVLCAKILTLKIGHTNVGKISLLDLLSRLGPIVLAVAIFAVSQIVINNKGLSKHDPTVIVPIYSSTFVLCSALEGLIFFQEYLLLSIHQMLGYALGVSAVVSGVLLIAADASSKSKEKLH